MFDPVLSFLNMQSIQEHKRRAKSISITLETAEGQIGLTLSGFFCLHTFFSPSLCLFRFDSVSSAKFVLVIDYSALITYLGVLSLECDGANVTQSPSSTGQQLHLTGTIATFQSFPKAELHPCWLFSFNVLVNLDDCGCIRARLHPGIKILSLGIRSTSF